MVPDRPFPVAQAVRKPTIAPKGVQYWDKFAIFAIRINNLWLIGRASFFSPWHTPCRTSEVPVLGRVRFAINHCKKTFTILFIPGAIVNVNSAGITDTGGRSIGAICGL
jgi:hypothetical protein